MLNLNFFMFNSIEMCEIHETWCVHWDLALIKNSSGCSNIPNNDD